LNDLHQMHAFVFIISLKYTGFILDKETKLN